MPHRQTTLRNPVCPRSAGGMLIAGSGTAVNVCTVLVGSSIGVLAGNRLPARTRDLVTDALGLVTLLIAGLSAGAGHDPAPGAEGGPPAPPPVRLGALGICGLVRGALWPGQ